ncbi:MAG: iron-containing alcohol dehydrogenase [Candidatus Thorarchaeota archaeon]|jgi:alcohol dehydrogenase class IV
MSWEFTVPPKIAFGEESIEVLETIQGQSAFIITDEVINKLGYPDTIAKILTENRFNIAIWDCAEPDPKVSNVKDAAEAMRAFEADIIIAIGGGSVMDTAKAAWVLYERPDIDLAALNPFDELGLRAKARLICIPTTAGTGSEVTKAVVIRDDETGRKMATINTEMVPDLAILEPAFTKDLPKNLTAYTGMDALTHAVEAYVSSWKNDFSDACTLKAVQIVFEWLPKAVENPEDLEARGKMLVAANLAGMAFSNSQVALGHSLGHSMGAVLRLQHGLAVGMALPNTIEFNTNESEEAAKNYAELARVLNVTLKNPKRAARKFAEMVRELMAQVGSPTSLKAAGVKKKDFKANLDKLVDFSMQDAAITMNPRNFESSALRKIYEYMYDGTPIDF